MLSQKGMALRWSLVGNGLASLVGAGRTGGLSARCLLIVIRCVGLSYDLPSDAVGVSEKAVGAQIFQFESKDRSAGQVDRVYLGIHDDDESQSSGP